MLPLLIMSVTCLNNKYNGECRENLQEVLCATSAMETMAKGGIWGEFWGRGVCPSSEALEEGAYVVKNYQILYSEMQTILLNFKISGTFRTLCFII